MYNFNLTATKEFTWDCAHVLAGHQGLCKNLHGHTYKMLVTAQAVGMDIIQEGPSAGMVVDFKELKNYVQVLIVDKLDHATIIDVSNEDPFETALYHLLRTYDMKIFEVKYRPTAENMAASFLDMLNAALFRAEAKFHVTSIRLYETPTSYAEISLNGGK